MTVLVGIWFLMNYSFLFTVPTLLTLIRMIISPFLLPLLLVTFIPYNNFFINICLTLTFSLLSLTDFLDGFLARRLGQETELGKVLDPIADKFLLYSSLIGLLVVHRIYYYWVILLIGREFFIMGLRLVALENNFKIPVSYFGKAKTAIQFVYLTLVIFNPAVLDPYLEKPFFILQSLFLMLTLVLSLGSAYYYYKQFIATIGSRIYEGDFT